MSPLGLDLQQASSYTARASLLMFIIMTISSVWTVLPYGSSKQKTDTVAALLIFAAIMIFNVFALQLYGADRSLVAECSLGSTLTPLDSEEFAQKCHVVSVQNAARNASELERINALATLGQLIPLLSIVKDVLASWFAPSTEDPAPTTKSERQLARYKSRRKAVGVSDKLYWVTVVILALVLILRTLSALRILR
jgi:hypothetical protein